MAEGLLVVEALSEGQIRAGAKLVAAFDAAGRPPLAAYWTITESRPSWEFVIVPGDFDAVGRYAYTGVLREQIAAADLGPDLTMFDATVRPPDDPITRAVAVSHNGPAADGVPVRIRGMYRNGTFVENVLVYRVPEAAA